jgi:hypothetical protein
VKPDFCHIDPPLRLMLRCCLAVSARPVGYTEPHPSVVSFTLKVVAAVRANTAQQVKHAMWLSPALLPGIRDFTQRGGMSVTASGSAS